MKKLKPAYRWLVLLIFFSCADDPEKDQVMFVYRGKKYFSDSKNLLHADSASLRKHREHLASELIFYETAMEKIGKDPDLEEQVEQFRRQRYCHELEKKIIENNLDTLVTDQEIQSYYNRHSRDFLLPQTIIKILYVRFPLQNKFLGKVQHLIRRQDINKELNDLCSQFAGAFSLDLQTWFMLEEIRKNIPFLNSVSSDYLNTGKTYEFIDNQEWVYLKIIDRKNQNTLSPPGFVRNDIREKIIRERAAELILQYRKQLMEEALQKGELKWNP